MPAIVDREPWSWGLPNMHRSSSTRAVAPLPSLTVATTLGGMEDVPSRNRGMGATARLPAAFTVSYLRPVRVPDPEGWPWRGCTGRFR